MLSRPALCGQTRCVSLASQGACRQLQREGQSREKSSSRSHAKQLLHTIYQPCCSFPVKGQCPSIQPGHCVLPLVQPSQLHTCTKLFAHLSAGAALCDPLRTVWPCRAYYGSRPSQRSCRVQNRRRAASCVRRHEQTLHAQYRRSTL